MSKQLSIPPLIYKRMEPNESIVIWHDIQKGEKPDLNERVIIYFPPNDLRAKGSFDVATFINDSEYGEVWSLEENYSGLSNAPYWFRVPERLQL